MNERVEARVKRRREMKRWLLVVVSVLAMAGGARAADEAAAQEALKAQQELQRAELVVALPPVIGPEVRAVQILHFRARTIGGKTRRVAPGSR